MSRYTGGEINRVQTAITIKRHGESDKTVLQLIKELKDQ